MLIFRQYSWYVYVCIDFLLGLMLERRSSIWEVDDVYIVYSLNGNIA